MTRSTTHLDQLPLPDIDGDCGAATPVDPDLDNMRPRLKTEGSRLSEPKSTHFLAIHHDAVSAVSITKGFGVSNDSDASTRISHSWIVCRRLGLLD
jgi:hypothetical protein